MHTQLVFRFIRFFQATLFGLFWTVQTVNAAVPSPPILRAPIGQVVSITPSYQWTIVAGANSYQLSITDSTGRRYSAQYQASQKCKAASKRCSVTPKLTLTPGNTSWKVRAGNADGWGAWSVAKQITVAPALDSVQNVLEAGDHYDYVTEIKVGTLLFADMWRVLHESHAPCWISEFSRHTQYQFYEDPSFSPGPLYRFNGFDVSVGQVSVHTIGWYFRAGQSKPFKAAYVNAGIGDFLLVLADADTFVEAFWHNGTALVVTPYHIGNQCL